MPLSESIQVPAWSCPSLPLLKTPSNILFSGIPHDTIGMPAKVGTPASMRFMPFVMVASLYDSNILYLSLWLTTNLMLKFSKTALGQPLTMASISVRMLDAVKAPAKVTLFKSPSLSAFNNLTRPSKRDNQALPLAVSPFQIRFSRPSAMSPAASSSIAVRVIGANWASVNRPVEYKNS